MLWRLDCKNDQKPLEWMVPGTHRAHWTSVLNYCCCCYYYVFFRSPGWSHSGGRDNKYTFLERLVAFKLTSSDSEPMQYGRQFSPWQPTTICFLISATAHATFGCNLALSRSIPQPDRALLGESPWLIPSHISSVWLSRRLIKVDWMDAWI